MITNLTDVYEIVNHGEEETLTEVQKDDDDWEPELTAEDYAEWCAASCGCGYYTYIGKPWLDD